MNLQEQISRMKSIMGLLVESVEDKQIVLLDGTSSAGKSHTLKHLKAVPYHQATDTDQWIVIGSDDFSGKKGENNRIKYDHEGDGPDQNAGEEFHKRMRKEREGELGQRGETTVAWNGHPHNKDLIKGTDTRVWYMTQEVKYSPWKKIVIDDIGKDILKYLPEVNFKYILLHTPIYLLLKNVSERNERAKNDPEYEGDERDPLMVLKQYTEKYEATKSKPNENEGDPTTVITKGGLTKLFKDNGLSEEDIDEVLNKLGITDDGDYYIKVKDSYLTPETQLVNVDSERTVYLKDIDRALI